MSGFKVNFSVNNQLATPSIHAAALANRPTAGQPGRLFVDTDNPSTGIYRDTGTVWENITGGAGAGNLQTVTDAGNTTDNNILLTYADNTLANALVFYNDQLAQEEYLIEKRGTGITTNDSLAIQSRGNISPSTNPVGFLIDGANDVIKSFYTTAYTELGLKLDFANNSYVLGGINDGYNVRVTGFDPNGGVDIGDYNLYASGTQINLRQDFIKTQFNGNDIGLKLDFANNDYSLGNSDVYWNISNGGTNGFYVVSASDWNGIVCNFTTVNSGIVQNVIIGDAANLGNNTYLSISDSLQRLDVSGNLASGTAGGSSGQHLKIRVGGTDYKIALLNP